MDGKRTRRPLQLCLCTSNREMTATLIENILQYIRESPETRIVGVIPEDGRGVCQCDECRKMDDNPEDADKVYTGKNNIPEGENRSKMRRYALLLNEVARAVGKEFPRVKIGAAAYIDIRWPPRDVKLEPNIVVWIAVYWRCAVHELSPQSCPPNEHFFDVVEQWRDTQPCEIILYEYYMGMNAQKALPYPMADVIIRQWPRLKQLGVGGATLQSREHDHNTYSLNYQAFARIGWDSNVDYTSLRNEFLEGMFGSLAETVRPIYDELDKRVKFLEQTGSDSPFVGSFHPSVGCLLPNGVNVAFFLENLDMPAMIEKIRTVSEKTGDERERRQAAAFIEALQYWHVAAQLYRTWDDVEKAESRGEPETARDLARKTLEETGELLEHIVSLPPRGWIRNPSIFLKISEKIRKRRKWPSPTFSWLREKAGVSDPRQA